MFPKVTVSLPRVLESPPKPKRLLLTRPVTPEIKTGPSDRSQDYKEKERPALPSAAFDETARGQRRTLRADSEIKVLAESGGGRSNSDGAGRSPCCDINSRLSVAASRHLGSRENRSTVGGETHRNPGDWSSGAAVHLNDQRTGELRVNDDGLCVAADLRQTADSDRRNRIDC